MAAGTHGVAAACAALPGRVSTGRGHHIDLVPLRRHDLQGVEGGVWQAEAGSLAYAFSTYEGTGEKTDLPQAEQPSIRRLRRPRCSMGLPWSGARRPVRKSCFCEPARFQVRSRISPAWLPPTHISVSQLIGLGSVSLAAKLA